MSRYALPLVLFVAVIGGIAWLTQYMPSWRTPEPAAIQQSPQSEVVPVVKFDRNRATWTADDPDYVREYERGVEGHYDFPFVNLLDEPVELGLMRVSCDCTFAHVAVLPDDEWQRVSAELAKTPWADVKLSTEPAWQKIERDEAQGAKIPARDKGLFRISWKGRKETGERLRINLVTWAEPEDKSAARVYDGFEVPVQMAQPVMFEPNRQSVGYLAPGGVGRAEFKLWSATRGPYELNVTFPHSSAEDPLWSLESRPLTPEECKRLAAELRENKIFSDVRAGYHLVATVHESKGGRQLDQGPFARVLPMNVDDLPTDYPGPTVTGTVRGDVEVGAPEDLGKVNLKSFAAGDGTRRGVTIWAKPGQELELVSQQPAALQVKLAKDEKGGAAGRARWELEVAVPPGAWAGPLPESAVVILRIAGATRQIRIPVIGTAGSGPF